MYYVFVFSSEILCIEQILFVISIYLFIILSIQLSAHLFIFYLIFSIYLSFHYLSVFLGERSLKSEISNLLVEKSTLDARINSLMASKAGEKQVRICVEECAGVC